MFFDRVYDYIIPMHSVRHVTPKIATDLVGAEKRGWELKCSLYAAVPK